MYFQTNLKSLILSTCMLIFFASCSKDELEIDSQQTAITVKLKGAQDNLQNLLIDIQDVQLLIGTDALDTSNWMSLNAINKGVYNVSQLNHDNELLLVDAMIIPSGQVYKIKLVLGDENAIVLNNQTQLLESDAEELSSSNVVSKNLESNKNYEFTLEFESDNSIIMDTDDHINFVPQMNTLMRHTKL